MALRIGDTAPNFTIATTNGEINFHDWAKGNVKKEGSVSAVFKYRTNYVGYITADDADALFNSFLTD